MTMTRTQRLTLITAVAALLAVLGTFLFLRLRPGPTLSVQEGGGYAGQPTLGEARAPVKVILFENFLCEHCKLFESEAFVRLERDYIDTGRVEVYYVNLAWGDPTAVTAGRAGECAFSQNPDAFWEYKRALFAAQGADGWATLAKVLEVAGSIEGLEPEQLEACITEGQTQAEVARDLELADFTGVTGTPSVIVGNQGFEAPSYETLRTEIETQLAQTR